MSGHRDKSLDMHLPKDTQVIVDFKWIELHLPSQDIHGIIDYLVLKGYICSLVIIC